MTRKEPTVKLKVYEDGVFFAGVEGPKSEAWAEAFSYARQCTGRVEVHEIRRRNRGLSKPATPESR